MPWCGSIDELFSSLCENESVQRVVVDLTETEGIDSTALGMLAKLGIDARRRFSIVPCVVCANPDINRLLHSMGMERVFDMTEDVEPVLEELQEMPYIEHSEEGMKNKVIEAHRTLMGLSEENRKSFGGLVDALEKEKKSP